MTRDQNPARAAEIEAWVTQVASAYNVLAMDERTFRCWARRQRGVESLIE